MTGKGDIMTRYVNQALPSNKLKILNEKSKFQRVKMPIVLLSCMIEAASVLNTIGLLTLALGLLTLTPGVVNPNPRVANPNSRVINLFTLEKLPT